jgi:hypothetical protein
MTGLFSPIDSYLLLIEGKKHNYWVGAGGRNKPSLVCTYE